MAKSDMKSPAPIHAKTVPARLNAAWLAACVALCAGCHVAPPRYQTTWERATSGCYQPNVYCYGYSPTTWTRFPEHCAHPDYVIVEEVIAPSAQPTPAAGVLTPPPLPDPAPVVPQIEIPEGAAEPQSATPPHRRRQQLKSPGPKTVKRSRDDADWSAHLRGYLGEVTRWR